ncbi:DUF4286 family protein [Pseudolysinimonas kribbensis]|uniref:DUF4286 family protein n=1 Tax=Pseudolysinimonas kribbensis TaxID=433641 RepID=UPI0024E120F3|nr:DUF4286 family protein [Pseudolysinimonas kribbensis]
MMIAIDPGDDLAALRQWCATVRTPAVLAVPGVSSATEWEVVVSFRNREGGGKIAGPPYPGYIVRYELEDIAVAHTDAFLDAVGRGFGLEIEVNGAPVVFDQFMRVTAVQIRDHVNPEAATTPVGGMLVVSHSPEREYIDLYNDWMDEEHVDELMSCPGYLRTRRFKAVDGIPNFFAMYEIDSPDALNSPRMLSFSTRRDDQKPPLHQKIAKHMVESICDVYQLLA